MIIQWDSFPGGEGNGTPLQYFCLENPMDGGAWWAAVHGVAKSRTRLSNFTFTFHFHALEKEMATHSSVLSWRIPGTGEPGGRLSMGSHRVGHDWSDLAAAAAAFPGLFWTSYLRKADLLRIDNNYGVNGSHTAIKQGQYKNELKHMSKTENEGLVIRILLNPWMQPCSKLIL